MLDYVINSFRLEQRDGWCSDQRTHIIVSGTYNSSTHHNMNFYRVCSKYDYESVMANTISRKIYDKIAAEVDRINYSRINRRDFKRWPRWGCCIMTIYCTRRIGSSERDMQSSVSLLINKYKSMTEMWLWNLVTIILVKSCYLKKNFQIFMWGSDDQQKMNVFGYIRHDILNKKFSSTV